MTKQELIDEISSLEFCKQLVGDTSKIGDESGIPIYRQSYLEVVDNSALVQSVDFYVIDEGTDNEEAYYKQGQEPKPRVAEAVAQIEAAKASTLKAL